MILNIPNNVKNTLTHLVSILSPFFMGLFYVISTIIEFSWISLNYSMVMILISIIKCLILFYPFSNTKNAYLIGATGLLILTCPLCVSMIKTIFEREKPNFIFEWITYAYALYATIKMIFSIKKIISNKNGPHVLIVDSLVSIISACYTIQMLEFILISSFGEGDNMLTLQLISQATILCLNLFFVMLMIKKYINKLDK